MNDEILLRMEKADYTKYGKPKDQTDNALRFIRMLNAVIPLRHIDVTDWTNNRVNVYVLITTDHSHREYKRFSLFDVKQCLKWWEKEESRHG